MCEGIQQVDNVAIPVDLSICLEGEDNVSESEEDVTKNVEEKISVAKIFLGAQYGYPEGNKESVKYWVCQIENNNH